MTNEEFDKARFYKGMRCTINCEVVGVDFTNRIITVRMDGKRGTVEVRAANVTLIND